MININQIVTEQDLNREFFRVLYAIHEMSSGEYPYPILQSSVTEKLTLLSVYSLTLVTGKTAVSNLNRAYSHGRFDDVFDGIKGLGQSMVNQFDTDEDDECNPYIEALNDGLDIYVRLTNY